jgi:hypothetical protein
MTLVRTIRLDALWPPPTPFDLARVEAFVVLM